MLERREGQVIRRGECYYIAPQKAGMTIHSPIIEPTGSEQSSDRYAIVISNNINNEYSNVITVVYITAQEKKPMPTHVEFKQDGLFGTVLCEASYGVSIRRFGNLKGRIKDATMDKVDRALAISMGIDYLSAGIDTYYSGKPKLDALTPKPVATLTSKPVEVVTRTESGDLLKVTPQDIEVSKLRNELELALKELGLAREENSRVSNSANVQEYSSTRTNVERDMYKDLYESILDRLLPPKK